MGNKQTAFTDEQLEAYQDCTFFTRKDILRIFKRFRELNPDIVPKDMKDARNPELSHTKVDHEEVERMPEFKLPLSDIITMPEIKENPFKYRICEVFSEDGTGNMTFDDFLDMFSVFSEAAPRDIKALYAFKIFDYDSDNSLGRQDLSTAINLLTRNELTTEELGFICDKVFEEADLDDDGQLSYTEFEHVISRAPDFLSTFHIRI